MNIFKTKLKLVKGTKFVSFLFIGCSMLIAAGILFAANIYFNIDTGEVVTEQIQRVTGILRATAGLIVGGAPAQNPAAGISLQIASGDVLLSAAGQLLRFSGGTGHHVGFRADAITATTDYVWPTAYPAASGRVLQSTTDGTLSWLDLGAAGLGDVLAVGDCASGECFTPDGLGNALWFEGATADAFEIQLTAADPTADHTITLPAVTGTVALGTGTAGHVAFWTGANTLAGEAQLLPARGGTGANSSAWNGMVRVVAGGWAPVTGTAGHAAFWSDANTVAAEAFLSVGRGGTGRGTFTSRGILYGMGTGALGVTAAGSTNQLFISQGGAISPIWSDIAGLITTTNGLTETGTSTITLRLGGALTETTTITQGAFNMIFDMTGTGDFIVRDTGVDLFTVTDDGRVLFRTHLLAGTGKQVLREMIPILGFDLPVQTATTSFVAISRIIEDHPFSPAETGTTRVHKFVIRYADATTTASTDWRVWNVTGATTTASFSVPPTPSTNIEAGRAHVTGSVAIPPTTDDWRLELRTPGTAIRVFQVFLAAYDEML